MFGSLGALCPVNLPQLPCHLQPELSCLSAASALANTFHWAASPTGPFPRGALCQALPPSLPRARARWWGSIPATLPRAPAGSQGLDMPLLLVGA